MARATVKFSVSEKGNVRATWLDVDEKSVTLVNGKGSIQLEKGKEFELRWFFLGNSGDSISIEGKQGDDVIVEVKKSSIPSGRDRHANNKSFKTKR